MSCWHPNETEADEAAREYQDLEAETLERWREEDRQDDMAPNPAVDAIRPVLKAALDEHMARQALYGARTGDVSASPIEPPVDA